MIPRILKSFEVAWTPLLPDPPEPTFIHKDLLITLLDYLMIARKESHMRVLVVYQFSISNVMVIGDIEALL